MADLTKMVSIKLTELIPGYHCSVEYLRLDGSETVSRDNMIFRSITPGRGEIPASYNFEDEHGLTISVRFELIQNLYVDIIDVIKSLQIGDICSIEVVHPEFDGSKTVEIFYHAKLEQIGVFNRSNGENIYVFDTEFKKLSINIYDITGITIKERAPHKPHECEESSQECEPLNLILREEEYPEFLMDKLNLFLLNGRYFRAKINGEVHDCILETSYAQTVLKVYIIPEGATSSGMIDIAVGDISDGRIELFTCNGTPIPKEEILGNEKTYRDFDFTHLHTGHVYKVVYYDHARASLDMSDSAFLCEADEDTLTFVHLINDSKGHVNVIPVHIDEIANGSVEVYPMKLGLGDDEDAQ